MNIYALPEQLHTVPAVDRIIAVGVFDGVHIGHSAVLTKALTVHDLVPAVFTFQNTDDIKRGGCLQTAKQRQDILERLEFADLFEADFCALRDMSPADFVQLLHRDLHAKAVVCGFNFRFGKGGAGDTALLQSLCEQVGIRVFVQPAVTVDGQAVSSTRIKEALKAGDMATVLRLQGRPYTIRATVKNGQHLGRKLGFPTINQTLSPHLAGVRFGVYAATAIVDGKMHAAVTNVGVRPTVSGEQTPLAESYILDFDGDLYEKSVTVELIKFLRPEQKFQSVQALQQAIREDAENARAVFAPRRTVKPRAVVFDFDNTLADSPLAFHCFVEDWIRKHFPQMPKTEVQSYCAHFLKVYHHGFVPYEKVMDAIIEMLPWDVPPARADIFAFLKVAYAAHTTPFADAKKVLCTLRERGYQIGILTNGYPRVQNSKIDVSTLRPLLDYTLISGEEGVRKPHAEVFRRAAMRLGVHPADCVFVGDNPKNDIDGALQVGMRAVFMDFQYPDVTVDASNVPHVSNLSELLDLL